MDEHETRALTDDETGTHLGLWDAVSIIVGIVVGTAIFRTPQMVFGNVPDPLTGLACWALGGVLALLGALCYAELATTYPRMGGDYVYLSRAYGRWMGFLFGWGRLTVILTGSIGIMAYAFGDYAVAFWGLDPLEHPHLPVWLAAGSIVVLTVFNLLGVICGKTVQNILSSIKVLGLAGVVVVGLLWGGGQSLVSTQPMSGPGFGLAMVFVLYAYGGWNDAAFVASEVRQRHRNMPLALILGTCGITLIYLLVNAAYLWSLGFEGVRASAAPAAEVLQLTVGDWGARAITLLVMLSALGAINGMIFTGARIYVSMGTDHRIFAWLGRWNPRRRTPVWSLLVQSVIALLLVLIVGTVSGQQWVDRALALIRLDPLPWAEYDGGFNTLLAGTAPVFWIFFLLTGFSLFILRAKDPDKRRPFSAPWYPWTPILFCTTCYYMLYSAVTYAGALSLLGIVPLAVGVPLYVLNRGMSPGGRGSDKHPGIGQDV